jgi:hypothetical protein
MRSAKGVMMERRKRRDNFLIYMQTGANGGVHPAFVWSIPIHKSWSSSDVPMQIIKALSDGQIEFGVAVP